MSILAPNQYTVPVPCALFDQVEQSLGQAFTGTVNQIDQWVKANLGSRHEDYKILEAYREAYLRAKRYPSRYIWTVYEW